MFFGAGFGGVVSFIKGGMEPRWGKNRLEGRRGFDTLDSRFGRSRLSLTNRLPKAQVAQEPDSDRFSSHRPCVQRSEP